MSSKPFLITGATGSIGRNVVEFLLERGHKVRLLFIRERITNKVQTILAHAEGAHPLSIGFPLSFTQAKDQPQCYPVYLVESAGEVRLKDCFNATAAIPSTYY